MRTFIFLLSIAVSPAIYALEALSDEEMSQIQGGISPQAALDSLSRWIERAADRPIQEQAALEALFATSRLLMPWVQVLNADLEVVGVDYGGREPVPTGEGVSLPLPAYIERISLRDLRPAGGARLPSMGTIHFEGIRFQNDSHIFIKER